MRPLRHIGLLLAHIGCIRRAILEQASPRALKAKSKPRFVIGVSVVVVSYGIGWPAAGLLGSLALYFEEPELALTGAPALYGFSWILLGVGLTLAGREAIPYSRALARWWVRLAVERMIGDPPLIAGGRLPKGG